MEEIVIADITGLNKDGMSFGHFFRVAKMFETIFSCQAKVVVTGGPVYKNYIGNKELLKYDIDLKEFDSPILKFKAKIKEVLNGVSVLKKYKNSIIIFQDYSNTSMFLSICLRKTNCSIYIIQYKCEIDTGINKFLYKVAKKRITGILCTKKETGEKYGLPFLVMPDYIQTEKNEQKSECLQYDFGIFGIIRKGKDVVGVAEMFVGINRSIIIAGSIQDQYMKDRLEKLARDNINITVIDRYLSDDEYNGMIASTQCIVLPYVDEYYNESSSGVVYDVLFAEKPVITRNYEIFKFIDQYHIGILYDNLDDIDFSIVMNETEYINFKKNIKGYLACNRSYKKKLREFMGSRSNDI